MNRHRVIYTLLVWLSLIGAMTGTLTAQSSQTIVNNKAGSLSSKLSDLEGVTDLTVQGVMDATDLAAIAKALPDLLRLDLEKVTFKAYFDPYDPYSGSSADCFPIGLNGKMKSLQELILPSSITKISSATLFGLKALTKLTCPTAVVPTVEGYGQELTSDEIYAQCTLYVQEELVEAFKQSDSWKAFHAILPIPKPFEADLSMTVATSATFSITVGAQDDAVTAHYPDGFQETKVGADGALTLAFSHTIDQSKVADEKRILISAPKAIRLTTQGTGLTACTFMRELPLQELTLRFESELTALDLSQLSSLTAVNLSRCGKLTSLTLPSTAPQLKSLQLPNTAVSSLTLTSYPALEELDLASVGLSQVTLTGLTKLRTLDLSDNKLTSIDLTGLTAISTLRVGNNQLTELTLSSTSFDELNVEHNHLSSIDLSRVTKIGALYCNDNNFTLDKLPAKGAVISAYRYAPQAKHQLPQTIAQGEVLDLSAIASVQGVLAQPATSTFSWYDNAGNLLTEGTDYEIKGAGQFAFLRPFADSVYCQVKSKAFPKFTGKSSYKTTSIAITEPVVTANFTYYTSQAKQNFSVKTTPSGTVSVRTADGVTLQATGDDEYGIARFAHLIDTDKVSDPKHMKMEIVCDQMYSFAAQATGISEVELTDCPQLKRLTLKYQQLSSIDLSKASNLEELYLDGNEKLEQVGLTGLSSLRWLNVSNLPKLKTLDLAQTPGLTHLLAYNTQCANMPVEICTNLEVLDLTNTGSSQLKVADLTRLKRLLLTSNNLKKIETAKLTALTELQVDKNQLTELVLHAPNLETLNVTSNQLTALDLSQATGITTLYCSDNKLSLDKLPTLAIDGPAYVYAPQAPMSWSKDSYSTDDAIDLSHLTQLRGVLAGPATSVYACFDAKSKAQLQEGTDYKVLREGVFQLLAPHADGVFFTITTPAFPAFTGDKAYQTEPIVITQGTGVCSPIVSKHPLEIVSGSEGISLTAQEALPYALYDLSGVCHYQGTLQTGRTELSLACGSYLLVYQLGNRSYSVKVVVTAQ